MRPEKELAACKHFLVLVPAYLRDQRLRQSGNEGKQILHKELGWLTYHRSRRVEDYQLEAR